MLIEIMLIKFLQWYFQVLFQNNSCPIGDSPLTGSIINSTGMNVYDVGNVKDFVIAPGQMGKLSMNSHVEIINH